MQKIKKFSCEDRKAARSYVDKLDDNTLAYIIDTVMKEHCSEVIMYQVYCRKNNVSFSDSIQSEGTK